MTSEWTEFLKKPDPKNSARGIDRRASESLRALERANKGKDAERTGVSARTLSRINTR